MDENQVAKPKPGKVAKVRQTLSYKCFRYSFLSEYGNIWTHLYIFQFFVRALFSYNPETDNLLPCQDIGLSFNYGDVMEVGNGIILREMSELINVIISKKIRFYLYIL